MSTLSTAGLLLLAAAIAIPAAAKTHSENITLYHDAVLNGTNLPAGDYTVKYDVDGSTAQVKIMRGSKVVASTSGQMKELDKKMHHNQVVMNTGGGSRTISEIDFGSKESAITFDTAVANGGK